MMSIRPFLLSVFTVVSLLVSTDARTDRNAPHHHRGLLAPYQPGPFQNLRLSSQDEGKLQKGDAVMKQTQGEGGGGGAICVQDIDAPKAAVWNQILDLEHYKGKVPKVNHCSNYHVSKKPVHSQRIKTRMVLGVLPGYSYESYYDHTFHPDKDSMVWTLDYDKTSDMDDVSGHWHLEEAPSGQTRVFYACDIRLKGSVPGPILNYLSKAALKSATAWVKKESEKHPSDTSVAESYHYHSKQTVHSAASSESKQPRGLVPAFFRRGGAFLSRRYQC